MLLAGRADVYQIAAILDKSIPGERAFLFWNIVITHMLAVRGPDISLDTNALPANRPAASRRARSRPLRSGNSTAPSP